MNHTGQTKAKHSAKQTAIQITTISVDFKIPVKPEKICLIMIYLAFKKENII